jgi:biopolymer transport protein ExbD/biopolymer transport protein TolR
MRSKRRPRRRGNAPSINVTPLVDVVLVLLIIFMVIAPQLEQGVRVELPGIEHPDPKVKGGLDPLTLTVTADGALYLEKEPLPADQLRATLAEAHRREPERRLLLKADQALPYGKARPLFVAGHEAGFPGVALVVGDKARRGGDD